MVALAWSVKAEYMYADFRSENYGSNFVLGGVDVAASIHTVKAGINYHIY